MDSGEAPLEEDFSVIPIAERIVHKNWKARVNGYDALIKAFGATPSEMDPVFRPYIQNPDILKKIVTDSNVVAQEKGLEVVLNLVKFAGETTSRTRDVVIPAVVDKCFGSTRQGTKQKAIALCVDYVEVENSGEGVVRDVLTGLNAKQPKIVAASAAAINAVIRSYGIKVTPPGPIFKVLPKIFGHSDKSVRAEGTLIVQALYSWIGPALLPSLSELKPVQIKELSESFEALDKDGRGQGTGSQERYTKNQQREREAAEASGATAQDVVPDELEVDIRSFVEEVDIMPQVAQDFHTNMASSKWKDRKEALDALLAIIEKAPRIKEGNGMSEIVKALAKRQTDANINCVMTAATIIGLLAKAIGKDFGKYRAIVVPPMLDRLKERKASVVDAIGAALDDFFTAVTFVDLTDEFLLYLKNKNPQVKEGTLKFFNRCLSTTRVLPKTEDLKPYCETLVALMGESLEPIRVAAFDGLALFMKIFGERMMNPYLDVLDDIKKGKVKDALEKVTVKCKVGAAAPPPRQKSAPVAIPPKKAHPPKPESAADVLFDDDMEVKKPLGKPPARLLARKPTAVNDDSALNSPALSSPKPSAPAPKKLAPAVAAVVAKSAPKIAAPSAAATPSDSFKYKFTPEDAEGRIAEAIPPELVAELGDGAWKVRLAALDESFPTWLDSVIDTLDAELIFRFLGKKPGWNEKNFQVSAKVYGIIISLAERSPTFSKACIALAASHLVDKLGDVKLKKPAGNALIAFAEKTSLSFVLGIIYEPISKQKAPKTYAESISWVDGALTDFGISGLALRPLVDFLKQALGNSNALVRSNATAALVTLRLFAGSGIKDLLEGLSPQLLATISSEFDKVERQEAPIPTRQSADVRAAVSTSGGKVKATGDPLDELFPRVDLEKIVASTKIIEESKSDAWKVRKEALEGLQALLNVAANKRLKSNLGDIAQMLKPRLGDMNKTVQGLALDIIGRIATGMNKPFEKYTRILVPGITQVTSDQKPYVRASATACLTAVATACEGIDSMVNAFGAALETPNPLQRGTLLNWLSNWISENGISDSTDLSSWAGPLILCLDDKAGDVRKGAQAVMPIVISRVGFDRVMDKTSVLKPASRTAVTPFLIAARNAGTPSAPMPVTVTPLDARAAEPVASTSTTKSSVPASESLVAAPRKNLLASRLLPSASRPVSRAEGGDSVLSSPVGQKNKALGGLKRPLSVATKLTAPTIVADSDEPPFFGSNGELKRARLAKDSGRWIIEMGPSRKDLTDLLQHQMEPHTSRELIAMLFSHDHDAINDHIAGLGIVCDAYSTAAAGDALPGMDADTLRVTLNANLDLPLKYVSLKVHESQPNLISRCIDVVDNVLNFLAATSYILNEAEALCFVPTIIHKLGDAREVLRQRTHGIIQALPRTFSSSRLFAFLLEHGLRSKVSKTRLGALEEMQTLINKKGMAVCDPKKAFPVITSMVNDKDPMTRKAALNVIGEAYTLEGEKVWSFLGKLDAKVQTQVEERLRRTAGPSKTSTVPDSPAPPSVSRLSSAVPRPGSPSGIARRAGISPVPLPAASRLARPQSPAMSSPLAQPPPSSRFETNGTSTPSRLRGPSQSSRLAPPKSRAVAPPSPLHRRSLSPPLPLSNALENAFDQDLEDTVKDEEPVANQDDISITISSILSSDPNRSVDALKKLQKILDVSPAQERTSLPFQNLANHTDGLIETIVLQMAHVWDRREGISEHENYRLAKHLIQTLNTFCEHSILAESLPVDILTSLLEELTMRLLATDESTDSKVKDLSRFINMIILRLFSTARRINVFKALFNLLIQITKGFSVKNTTADSREAKLAELVLKCLWKLARGIPSDLQKGTLNPSEMFPALEAFLQNIPPNEWRARASAKVPCGDMPLRTIKVIIQHIVGAFGEDVYDQLSTSFDDPSATIVYPYVYRTLNNSAAQAAARPTSLTGTATSILPLQSQTEHAQRPVTPEYPVTPSRRAQVYSAGASEFDAFSRPRSGTTGSDRIASRPASPSSGNTTEPNPDAKLIEIIGHISSETTGALHKEGITELHHFLKTYPHKRSRVEKLLDATGPQFRKYLARALASRAAEDEERKISVAETLSRLESGDSPSSPRSRPTSGSARRVSGPVSMELGEDRALSRLHDIFHYQGRASVIVDSRRASLSSSLNGGSPAEDTVNT